MGSASPVCTPQAKAAPSSSPGGDHGAAGSGPGPIVGGAPPCPPSPPVPPSPPCAPAPPWPLPAPPPPAPPLPGPAVSTTSSPHATAPTAAPLARRNVRRVI
ncbi:MAG TPA: hypothetical protein ENK23_01665 [Sorangium sp.]|nr:hypothetical protein [Sorangium sp.]